MINYYECGVVRRLRLELNHALNIFIKGRAHKLTVVNRKATVTEIYELYSNQEETDTRIIMYLHYAAKQGFKSAVVRSPDSNIFFIMLYYAHDINLTVYHEMGFWKTQKANSCLSC